MTCHACHASRATQSTASAPPQNGDALHQSLSFALACLSAVLLLLRLPCLVTLVLQRPEFALCRHRNQAIFTPTALTPSLTRGTIG